MSGPPPKTPSRSWSLATRTVLLFLKGAAMGTSDLIPGVSGGTMALVMGIYQELIFSLQQLTGRAFWSALLRGDLRRAMMEANARFLITLVAGILAAAVGLSRLLTWLLIHRQALLFSFFLGLILSSVLVVASQIRRWGARPLVAIAASAVFAFVLVGLTPTRTPDAWWFLALAGAIAICALILPGISGAFILVLLGKYETILGAIRNIDLGTLAIFGVGAALGLLSFVRLLDWLFRHYHDPAMALLAGFMLGSLRKLWPWQEAGDQGLVLLAPPLGVPGGAAEVVGAALLFLLGATLVALLNRSPGPRPAAGP